MVVTIGDEDDDDAVTIVGVREVDGGDKPAHASVRTRRGETGGRGSWTTFERMTMMMIRMVKAMLTMIMVMRTMVMAMLTMVMAMMTMVKAMLTMI